MWHRLPSRRVHNLQGHLESCRRGSSDQTARFLTSNHDEMETANNFNDRYLGTYLVSTYKAKVSPLSSLGKLCRRDPHFVLRRCRREDQKRECRCFILFWTRMTSSIENRRGSACKLSHIFKPFQFLGPFLSPLNRQPPSTHNLDPQPQPQLPPIQTPTRNRQQPPAINTTRCTVLEYSPPQPSNLPT